MHARIVTHTHKYVVTADVTMTISPRHVCSDCLVTYTSQFHSPLTGPATHTANATPKPHPKFTDVRGVKPLPPRIHCAQDPKPIAYNIRDPVLNHCQCSNVNKLAAQTSQVPESVTVHAPFPQKIGYWFQ